MVKKISLNILGKFMIKGLNKVLIIGNLGLDPEVRYTPSGGAVVNIRVATSESWRDKNSGELQVRTEWHRIVLYNKLGEIANDYLRKGSKVYIEGFLRTNKWKDQNGVDKYSIDIIASNIQILDSKDVKSNLQSGYEFEDVSDMNKNEDKNDDEYDNANMNKLEAKNEKTISSKSEIKIKNEPLNDVTNKVSSKKNFHDDLPF